MRERFFKSRQSWPAYALRSELRRADRTIAPVLSRRDPGGSPEEFHREKLAPALSIDGMATTYILKSLKDGNFYYGSTTDIGERLKAHNAGKVRSTKGRRPLVLHYTEELDSKHDAILRERFFKSRAGYDWLKQKNIIVR